MTETKRDKLFENYNRKRELLEHLTQLENILEELGCDYGEEISENNWRFNRCLKMACEELPNVYKETAGKGNDIIKKLKLI